MQGVSLHQTEADRPGLQGELLIGQGLQTGSSEIPLQRGYHIAPWQRGQAVLPAAVPRVRRAQR